jgi:hypothetical protein
VSSASEQMSDKRLAEIRFTWPAMTAPERTGAMKELANEVERLRRAAAHPGAPRP